MDKNCSNCYWEHYKDMHCMYLKDKPKEEVCENHDYICYECDKDRANYKYDNKYYCSDCLLERFETDSYTVTHYTTRDGDYLGSDDDFDEVIRNLDEDIEDIDE